jgi:hypothetical protein
MSIRYKIVLPGCTEDSVPPAEVLEALEEALSAIDALLPCGGYLTPEQAEPLLRAQAEAQAKRKFREDAAAREAERMRLRRERRKNRKRPEAKPRSEPTGPDPRQQDMF